MDFRASIEDALLVPLYVVQKGECWIDETWIWKWEKIQKASKWERGDVQILKPSGLIYK